MVEAVLAQHVARLANSVATLVELQREEIGERRRPDLVPVSQAGVGLFLKAIPGMAARFQREVPAKAVTNTDGVCTVKCTCGEVPEVPKGALVPCKCDRWFLNTGESIRVTRTPAEDA